MGHENTQTSATPLAHFFRGQGESAFFSKSKVRGTLLASGPPLLVLRQNGGQTWNQGAEEP